jgi:hypothetical protein
MGLVGVELPGEKRVEMGYPGDVAFFRKFEFELKELVVDLWADHVVTEADLTRYIFFLFT